MPVGSFSNAAFRQLQCLSDGTGLIFICSMLTVASKPLQAIGGLMLLASPRASLHARSSDMHTACDASAYFPHICYHAKPPQYFSWKFVPAYVIFRRLIFSVSSLSLSRLASLLPFPPPSHICTKAELAFTIVFCSNLSFFRFLRSLSCAHILFPLPACAHILFPLLACAHILFPLLSCDHILFPLLSCAHILFPLLSCAHILFPLLSCAQSLPTPGLCSHSLPTPVLCSHSLPTPGLCSHSLPAPVLCSLFFPQPRSLFRVDNLVLFLKKKKACPVLLFSSFAPEACPPLHKSHSLSLPQKPALCYTMTSLSEAYTLDLCT